MTEQKETLEKLLSAAKLHVPFDGWGDVTFNASCEDAGLDPQIARLYCPRGEQNKILCGDARAEQT